MVSENQIALLKVLLESSRCGSLHGLGYEPTYVQYSSKRKKFVVELSAAGSQCNGGSLGSAS